MTELSKFSVYTILHGDKLNAHLNNKAGQETEAKKWASAARLLSEAQTANSSMPIIFADATDCSRLLRFT